jgi:predicted nucleotidyltransferase
VTAALYLSEEDRQIVCDILQAIAPADAIAWAFGSRTTGRARRYSDLDLAIDAGRQLTIRDFAELHAAFEESDLPYRVDIVDWRAIDESFRQAIAAQCVPVRDTTPLQAEPPRRTA